MNLKPKKFLACLMPSDEDCLSKIVIIIGCFNIFIAIFWIDASLFFMVRLRYYTQDNDTYFSELLIGLYNVLVLHLVILYTAVFMIVGASTRDRQPMLPYLIVEFIGLLYLFCVFISMSAFGHSMLFPHISSVHYYLRCFALFLFFLVKVFIYFTVVYYYREINNEDNNDGLRCVEHQKPPISQPSKVEKK